VKRNEAQNKNKNKNKTNQNKTKTKQKNKSKKGMDDASEERINKTQRLRDF
jgi:hypothetical protein